MKKLFRNHIAILIALTIAIFFSGLSAATARNGEIRQRVFIHFPRPDRTGSAACQVTTDTTRTNYALTGWHLTNGYNYKINYATVPSSIGSDIDSILAGATATWGAADPDKQFTNGGSSSATRARFDGTNLIAWSRLSGRALGIAYVWYRPATGQLVEADIVFNKRWSWSWNPASPECASVSSYDVQNIATHELGHVIGLDDLYNPADKDLTMYGIAAQGETKKNTLGPGDVLGANAVAP